MIPVRTLRGIGPGLPLFALLWLTPPATGLAQLAPTSWTESASVTAGVQSDSDAGTDIALPEGLSTSLAAPNWSVQADVTYGSPGPPEVTALAAGFYFDGSVPSLTGSASSIIEFEIRVRQTAPPPVSVTWVPVSWVAHGEAEISAGGFSAYASVHFSLVQDPIVLVDSLAYAREGGPVSWVYHLTGTELVHPEVPIEGDMTAVALIGSESLESGASSSARAYMDPTFEVADELIPGTAVSFRDYFEIEYGEGYWALGPAPARHTTWGRLKALY